MDKVRVGIVGVGGIGHTHLDNLAANVSVEVAAVCDMNRKLGKEKAAAVGAVYYEQADDMFEQAQLDAVFVCVPPFAHGQIEEQAAARGIHLFVEKPLGLEMASVQRKAAAIEKAGIIHGAGYCLRYMDIVRVARSYLQDKEIGMVRAHYLSSFVETPWWRDMSKSGGQLVEQATHTVDLVRYLAGEMSEVYAHMNLRFMKDMDGMNAPDVTSVSVVFESGAIGHIDSTCIQPDHRSGIELLGRGFRVVIDGSKLTIVDEEGIQSFKRDTDFYKAQDNAFIEAVRTGDRSLILSSYTDAMRTLEVTLQANESARSGVPIKLEDNETDPHP
jgi:predicted dehydrogenase